MALSGGRYGLLRPLGGATTTGSVATIAPPSRPRSRAVRRHPRSLLLVLALVATACGDTLRASDLDIEVGEEAVEPALGELVSVVDGFNRQNADFLGISGNGQVWATAKGEWLIENNQAEASGGYALALIEARTTSMEASVTPTEVTGQFWLIVRAKDADNYWRFGGSGEDGFYRLERIASGAVAEVAVETLVNRPAMAEDRISCAAFATNISCSVDGVIVARTDEAFDVGATKAGIGSYLGLGTRVDDFAVVVRDEADLDEFGPVEPDDVIEIDELSFPFAVDGPLDTVQGVAWTVLAGAFETADSAVRPTTSGFNLATVDVGQMGGTVEWTVSDVSNEFWVVFRVVDENNYYRFGPSPLTGLYVAEKVIDGVPELLEFRFERNDVAPENGDVIRLVQRDDDSIFLAVNRVHVVDGGDLELLDESRIGIASTGTGVAFDSMWYSTVTSAYDILDTFDREPESEFGIGPPDLGVSYGWANAYGTMWSIDDGELYNTGLHYGVQWLDTSSELADVSVTVTTRGELEEFLVFRAFEDGSHFRFGSIDGEFVIEQVTNWVTVEEIPGVTALSSPEQRDGQVLSVRQGLDGVVEAFVDGEIVFRFRDASSNRQGGHYGVATFGGDARFDDFTVAPHYPDSIVVE